MYSHEIRKVQAKVRDINDKIVDVTKQLRHTKEAKVRLKAETTKLLKEWKHLTDELIETTKELTVDL